MWAHRPILIMIYNILLKINIFKGFQNNNLWISQLKNSIRSRNNKKEIKSIINTLNNYLKLIRLRNKTIPVSSKSKLE